MLVRSEKQQRNTESCTLALAAVRRAEWICGCEIEADRSSLGEGGRPTVTAESAEQSVHVAIPRSTADDRMLVAQHLTH